MTKYPTLRYYTSSNRYAGWSYIKDVTLNEIINWIRSFNYIYINDTILNSSTSTDTIINILKRNYK